MIKKILGVLILVSIILLSLSLAIEINAYNKPYYENSYIDNNIVGKTGKSMDELLDITDKLILYLKNKGGSELLKPHFGEREILHMEDVLDLFILNRLIKYISIAILLISLFYSYKKGTYIFILNFLIKAIFFFYILFFGVVFILALDFSKSFLLFHLLFFDNDLWLLNPKTDLMIQMLPESFFLGMAKNATMTFLLIIIFVHVFIYLLYRYSSKRYNKKIDLTFKY